jgi:hypothetical protein
VGDSEWIYFAPYQEDAADALQELRRGEFAEGRFYKGYEYDEDEVPSSLSELVQRTTYRTHSILDVGFIALLPLDKTEPDIEVQGQWRVSGTGPREFVAVRRRVYLDGPDVPESFAARYAPTVFPLSTRQLWEIFDTEGPTKSLVAEAHEAGLLDAHLNRCSYFLVYEHASQRDAEAARPAEICFYGWSGGGP